MPDQHQTAAEPIAPARAAPRVGLHGLLAARVAQHDADGAVAVQRDCGRGTPVRIIKFGDPERPQVGVGVDQRRPLRWVT